MTSDLPAGRELDVRIATEVMGFVQCTNEDAHGEDGYPRETCMAFPDSPNDGGECELYSTTYEGMGLVLERMRELGWNADMLTTRGDRSYARFWQHSPGPSGVQGEEYADPLPHAVCLAALKAVRA